MGKGVVMRNVQSRREFLRYAAVASGATLLAGCAPAATPAAGSAGASGKPATVTTVNYGQITMTAFNWPFLIAESKGFFSDRGITLAKVVSGNTAATSQSLVAGATELAQMNLVQHMAANAAGADLVVLGGDVMVPVYTLIVESTIKSYADLKGKRIAVAGPTDPLNYVLGRMLTANGLRPADYEFVPVGGSPDRLAAVQKGATAASLLTQPDDFKAIAAGLGQLGQSTDYVDKFQYTVTSGRRDWVKSHEDLVVQFLRAYVRGTHYFYDASKRADVVKVLVDTAKAQQADAEKTYDLYQKSKRTIPADGDVDLDGARIVAQNWKEFGLSKEPASIDSIVDFSYLKKAQQAEKA
jgi:ABC-type nitrate/sulfonate/bicarbonate transport system substrate-binding protein